MVHKGMDYKSKILLIDNMQFMSILESFSITCRDRPLNDDDLNDDAEEEEEFFDSLSEIINKLG
jgi:hypothetical protein